MIVSEEKSFTSFKLGGAARLPKLLSEQEQMLKEKSELSLVELLFSMNKELKVFAEILGSHHIKM